MGTALRGVAPLRLPGQQDLVEPRRNAGPFDVRVIAAKPSGIAGAGFEPARVDHEREHAVQHAALFRLVAR